MNIYVYGFCAEKKSEWIRLLRWSLRIVLSELLRYFDIEFSNWLKNIKRNRIFVYVDRKKKKNHFFITHFIFFLYYFHNAVLKKIKINF